MVTDLGEPPDVNDKYKMRFYSTFTKRAVQKAAGWQWGCAEQKHNHQELIVSQITKKRTDSIFLLLLSGTAWSSNSQMQQDLMLSSGSLILHPVRPTASWISLCSSCFQTHWHYLALVKLISNCSCQQQCWLSQKISLTEWCVLIMSI